MPSRPAAVYVPFASKSKRAIHDDGVQACGAWAAPTHAPAINFLPAPSAASSVSCPTVAAPAQASVASA